MKHHCRFLNGQKIKQIIKGEEKNSRYTVMEKNLSLFVLTLQHQLHGLRNYMSKRVSLN